MQAYALPEPTSLERKLLAMLAESKTSRAKWRTFPDGELAVRTFATAGADACVIGRTMPPAENFFRTTLLIDTLRRAGAKDVTAVIPYLGYGRQDRQAVPGDAVTASFVVDAIAAAGAARIVTVDLHSDRIRESSRIQVESVGVIPEMAVALQMELRGKEFTIVAPDLGAKPRAEMLAAALVHREPAWIEKRRDPETGRVSFVDLHGDLRGKIAVLIDDILDTGSTIELAARALRSRKFSTVHLCITHPVFSDGAATRLCRLRLGRVFVTNTVPLQGDAVRMPGLRVLDVSKKIAAAVTAFGK